MDNFYSIWGGSFKIEGQVQGVGFRKDTKREAIRLGVRGYCMNLKDHSVVGVLEGPLDRYMKMKSWLTHVGSPKSVIEVADFFNERIIFNYTQPRFTIKTEDNDANLEKILNADDYE